MTIRKTLTCSLALAAFATVTPASAQLSLDDILGGGGGQGTLLETLIDEAKKHPLGSEENPVRADMPRGQKAYLGRLRCADGKAPQYARTGSLGVGPFGRIVDAYEVTCESSEPAKTTVVMDMYHPGYQEPKAVSGFTIEEAR